MSYRRPSNPLALAVLTLLDERPMHPYQMSNTLRERSKEQSIKLNYGSLYAVVESLLKGGVITIQETVREGRRPERTIYAITDAGRTVMVDWLSDLLETPAAEFPAFEAALSLMMVLAPPDAMRLLDRRLTALRMKQTSDRAILDSMPDTFPRVFVIESEYAIAMRAAELEFVRRMLEDLHAGTFSGLPMWQRLHDLRATEMSPDDIQAALTAEFAGVVTWSPPFNGT